MNSTSFKKLAGERAAEMITDGMVVGLGTGSTVAYAIEKLGEKTRNGFHITGIPTSLQTAIRATSCGIPLSTLDNVEYIDITIDGADQIDPTFNMIKGRGAAHVREKIVAEASGSLLIVADESKLVKSLTGPVPIEVIGFGLYPVIRMLQKIGGTVEIREGIKKDGPVISDNGNIIIDYYPDTDFHPEKLEKTINMLPGVVGCGIFSMFKEKTSIIVAGDEGCRITTSQSGNEFPGKV